jgi:hypothetical protein
MCRLRESSSKGMAARPWWISARAWGREGHDVEVVRGGGSVGQPVTGEQLERPPKEVGTIEITRPGDMTATAHVRGKAVVRVGDRVLLRLRGLCWNLFG